MSIASPIKGADSSDNNKLNVKELAREGYKVLIQRRTGGIDLNNGKRVPFVDGRFDETNRALRDTDMIPGDYAFPISPHFLDIDVQVDRFLHSGPTDFDGRLIAIDYELYGPNPSATISPGPSRSICAYSGSTSGSATSSCTRARASGRNRPTRASYRTTASTCTCGTRGTGLWMSGSTPGNTTRTPSGILGGGRATRGCSPSVLNSASGQRRGLSWT
jgi:hypothetical protein